MNVKLSQLDLYEAKTEAIRDEKHNCAHCHSHNIEEQETNTKSLQKKACASNLHQCFDTKCKIQEPHGHIQTKDSDSAKLTKKHKCNHKPSVFPLEEFIGHSKLPKALKEFTLNSSFLTPAIFSAELLENLPLPKFLKTWVSITTMHLLNRGKTKLPRLGLTYLITGFVNFNNYIRHQSNQKIGLSNRFARFIASTFVAILEKFSNSKHHDHKKTTVLENTKKEINTLTSNLQNKKQWLELLPSLLNIETKVQLITPLMDQLSKKLTENLDSKLKFILKNIFKIASTSASFVGFDQVLIRFSKSLFGENTNFVASLTSICSCCGSPVCSAAATDSAMNNSI